MSTESEKKGIEASFKSMDTEEFLDIYFNRPIGYAFCAGRHLPRYGAAGRSLPRRRLYGQAGGELT